MANYEWESVTLGQNPEIQKIVGAAAKASDLVTTNIGLAKTGLQLAQAFLIGIINPKVILLNAIADEIDNFVDDFRGTGFYVLEVVPTGMEVIPRTLTFEPVKMRMIRADIKKRWDEALETDANLTPDDDLYNTGHYEMRFKAWAERKLGEKVTSSFPSKAEYYVEVTKAKATYDDDEGVGDEAVCTTHPIFNIPMMSSTDVLAQMVAAMDDKLDDRRPQFSSSAEVGGIVIVMGFSDITETYKQLETAVLALISFFGGNAGLLTKGFVKTANLIAAPFKVLTDGPSEDDAQTFIINNVCMVNGTEETKEELEKLGKGDQYNSSGGFEVNDFVVGPRVKFGARVMGYVSEIVEDSEELDTPYAPYRKQTLKIIGASKLDTEGWKTLANGASIQQAHWFENENKNVNENSGEIKLSGKFNDFKYFTELKKTDNKILAQTKVKLQAGKALLRPVGQKEDVFAKGLPEGISTTQCVMGTVFEPKKKKAPPPNFKTAKLEDLIGDFDSFLGGINMFANTIRSMAGASDTALQEMLEFLDKLITKLDELNTVLQKILKIFTDGLPDGGVYVLKIPSTIGGNDAIKSAITSATNRPSDKLDFALGYMMMGGGPSMKVLNKLLAG